MRTFLFLVSLLLFLNCEEKVYEKQDFSDFQIINETKLDVGRIAELDYHNNIIYASDFLKSKILKFFWGDDNIQDFHSFGGEGEGPGEFRGVAHFAIVNDTLYAFVNTTLIHMFTTSGDYIRSIDLPNGILPVARFSVSEDGIYLFKRVGEYPIVKINSQGELIQEFGSKSSNEMNNLNEEASFILFNKANNSLFRVYKSKPLIEIYSDDGKLIFNHEIDDDLVTQDRVNFINTDKNRPEANENAVYHLYSDAYLKDNTLFLLIYDTTYGRSFIKKIVFQDSQIKSSSLYRFDEDFNLQFKTIAAIDNSTLIGYGDLPDSKLYEIKLN